MKPFAPAILAENRPECLSHSAEKCGRLCVPAGPYRRTRLTGWRTSGNACAVTTSGSRFRALALPTAARDSAVHFTLLAASGMIGNQRLEHSGEPRGKSFGSDTLGGNAGALA